MSYSSIVLKQSAHRTWDLLRYVAHRSCRRASTSSNPYPYPAHTNPQPHQIFHLPRSATQKQIKERYYDLVRIYHPDSPIARTFPADTAQVRFQAISKAYDMMRGKSAITGDVVMDRERPADSARFRPKASRRPHFDATPGDERWKERVLFGATVVAIVAFVVQINVVRHNAVGQATRGTRTGSSGAKYALTDEALAEPTEPERSP
ncbi:hypothetical protein JVT61DRAFT_2962 [Boletus reticuloceps]|uniref:J domain-containing protein n=1 Tax=Boletus reticuloceps TaxID=495285 RepID=A0A8I2YP17_9AGAM|nr:hypothetical protein JVT61DRAFT_2962 [Boletus reticuloceps]